MADKKMTKVEMFTAIAAFVQTASAEDFALKDEALEFIDKQIELIESKAAKAKAKAAEKKAEGDALREEVAEALTDTLQTADEITATVVEVTGDADITKAKVVARLTQLVNAGVAEKESVKAGSRKVMAYKLVGTESKSSTSVEAPGEA